MQGYDSAIGNRCYITHGNAKQMCHEERDPKDGNIRNNKNKQSRKVCAVREDNGVLSVGHGSMTSVYSFLERKKSIDFVLQCFLALVLS